jgi:hypothetical protein
MAGSVREVAVAPPMAVEKAEMGMFFSISLVMPRYKNACH